MSENVEFGHRGAVYSANSVVRVPQVSKECGFHPQFTAQGVPAAPQIVTTLGAEIQPLTGGPNPP